jgi:hypothetical protein
VRTIKENYLTRMILIGENTLRRAVENFVEHYNPEGPQQSLGNKMIKPRIENMPPEGKILRDPRLGGRLN